MITLHLLLIIISKIDIIINYDIDITTFIRMTGSFLSLLVIPMTILLLPKIELKKVLILITITWLAVALIQSYLRF